MPERRDDSRCLVSGGGILFALAGACADGKRKAAML
jgi:hypothetical protein